MCQTFATLNSILTILARYESQWHMVYYFFIHLSLSSYFFNWFFLSPHNLSLSPNQCSFLFRSDSQLLPQPQMSFSLFAPQIKPKNGVGCVACQSRSYANGNSNSQFKTKLINGIITNQTDLYPVRERTKESLMEARYSLVPGTVKPWRSTCEQ